MLPISLTIQGLYSYKTRQIIDFRALTADHLFGIFGAVGSGKSSILDAITFALYGEVERVGKRDELNRNIFNRQADEFLIDFEFESGAEGDLYRFVVKNSRKKSGEPNSFIRSAYIWKSGGWLPVDSPDASQIFNLSYDNFKRTVIIPQGRFQEFLQLGGKERTSMLMELFPKVSEFDLGDKVAIRKKATELEIANLAGNLEALGEISEAGIEAENQKITEAEARLKVQEAALNQATLDFRKLEDLRLIFDELESANQSLQILEEEKSSQDQRRKELDQYELIFKTFDSDIKLLDKVRLTTAKATQELDVTQSELGKTDILLQKSKIELGIAKAAADQIPDWEKELNDWSLVHQILKLREEIAKNQALEAEKRLELEAKSDALETQRKTLQTTKLKLETKETQADDLTQLLEAENYFREESRLKDEVAGKLLKLKQLELKLLDLKSQKESALPIGILEILTDINRDSKMSDQLRALGEGKLRFEMKIEQLQANKDDLLKKGQLFNFATQLADGEPCPLCGSVHHPEVISAEDVSAHRDENEKNIQQTTQFLKEIGQAETKLSGLQAELKGILESQKESQLEHEKALGLLKELQVKFVDNLFVANGLEALKTQIEANRKNQVESAQLKATVKKLESEIELKSAGIEVLKTQLNELNQTLASANGQISAWQLQIKLLKAKTWNTESSQTVARLAADLEVRISNGRKAYETASASHQALEKQFDQWQTTFQLKKEQSDIVGEELSVQSAKLDQKLLDLELGNEPFVREILALRLDTVQIRKSVEAFYTELLKAGEKAKNLRERAGNQLFSKDEWDIAKQKLHELTLVFDLEKGNLAVLRSDLENAKQALEKQAILRKKVRMLELRKDNLNTLFNLFKGQAFVNYASGIYLKNIVEMANQRFFRLTKQKLRLVLDGDNNFYVKDFLNGGHERLAKTLSGGQTFQASLSLALALADNVRHLTQSPRNFFFLDEGFGSLDKEALGLVFDTLHQLRHENRIVGIISHVEEMQQEIDKCLIVRLDDEKGSLVELAF